jgi:hypothetical protein
MAELIALPSLAMSPMAFWLMASDLRWASRAWLRTAASCSQDACNCSSLVLVSEKRTGTRSYGGFAEKGKTESKPYTHSEAASTSDRWCLPSQ